MSNITMGHKISPYLQLSHCLYACCFGEVVLPVKLCLSSPECSPPLVTSPPAAGAGCWLYTRIFPVVFAKALHNAVGTWPASCEEWRQKLWMSHSHSPWKGNPKTPSHPIHITQHLLQWMMNLDFVGPINYFLSLNMWNQQERKHGNASQSIGHIGGFHRRKGLKRWDDFLRRGIRQTCITWNKARGKAVSWFLTWRICKTHI